MQNESSRWQEEDKQLIYSWEHGLCQVATLETILSQESFLPEAQS